MPDFFGEDFLHTSLDVLHLKALIHRVNKVINEPAFWGLFGGIEIPNFLNEMPLGFLQCW